ncbi:hypothetical protein Back2_06050 [Nocardioides baekrokdamisoli]|uniref:PH domain-containing protein n=1 Tax=Nocardioides baekrokdamisoli TaxID=1804624 RepID=A0A3G9IYD4_9ACTN|nr:hypothetical protein [Nocardioides baekrokdamisoli]BBH16318.1 hypothetical protein Back2_06050 [Nocardioides baekrokdamisoli]
MRGRTPRGDRARAAATRIIGWISAAAAAALGAYLFVDSPTVGGARACLVVWGVAWVAWVVLVRPHVAVDGDAIVLTNSLRDLRIPAAAVDNVRVRSYLELTVGRKRYTSPAIGFKRSSLARGDADVARGLVASPAGRQYVESGVAYAVDYLRSAVSEAKSKGEDPGPVFAIFPRAPWLSLAALVLAAVLTFLV